MGKAHQYSWPHPGNTKGGKYHSTVDLLFDWFGISCMATDNFCFYLQNRLIQTSQTGGQWYSDTSPFSIPCLSIKVPCFVTKLYNIKRADINKLVQGQPHWAVWAVFSKASPWAYDGVLNGAPLVKRLLQTFEDSLERNGGLFKLDYFITPSV